MAWMVERRLRFDGWGRFLAVALVTAACLVVSPAQAGANRTPLVNSGCSENSLGITVTCYYGPRSVDTPFTVPSYVHFIQAKVLGGSGAGVGDARGGYGADVEARIMVSPGETFLSSAGSNALGPDGGSSGLAALTAGSSDFGGGGGQASLIYSPTINAPVILAGGGGGAGLTPGKGSARGGDADASGSNGGVGQNFCFSGGTRGYGQGGYSSTGGSAGEGLNRILRRHGHGFINVDVVDKSLSGGRGSDFDRSGGRGGAAKIGKPPVALGYGGGGGSGFAGGGGGGTHHISATYNCGGGGGAGSSYARGVGIPPFTIGPSFRQDNSRSPGITLRYSLVYIDASHGSDAKHCGQMSAPCKSLAFAVAQGYSTPNFVLAPATYCGHVTLTTSVSIVAQDSTRAPVFDNGFATGPDQCPKGEHLSVFTIGTFHHPNIVVTMTGMTIQHGDASANHVNVDDAPGRGGGIFVYPGAQLTLIDSTIANNTGCGATCIVTAGSGGGIYSLGSLQLVNTIVTGNTACVTESCHGDGGGIDLGAGSVGTPGLTLNASAVTGNVACTGENCVGRGGGVRDDGLGPTTLNGTNVDNNTGCGGARCIGQGGGISNVETINQGTVAGNVACRGADCTGFGGGISTAGTTNVTGSTLNGNSACASTGCIGYGGGIANILSESDLTLVNSTVTSNNACSAAGCNGYGGGITNFDWLSSSTLVDSTVVGNKACDPTACGQLGGGGGLYAEFGSTMALANSIVASNSGDPAHPDCWGGLVDAVPVGGSSGGHNLVGDHTGCGVSDLSRRDKVGPSPKIVLNLGSFGSYGGPTQTIPLLAGSSAIGAGDTKTCDAGTITNARPRNPITLSGPARRDQRGYRRGSKRCDIGAFEFAGVPKP